MPSAEVHRCQCPHCQQEAPHPDQVLHQQMNILLSRLDEQQRRWYAAIEANRHRPRGGAAGRANHGTRPTHNPGVDDRNWPCPSPSARRIGCVCRARAAHALKKRPANGNELLEIVTPETAGDPMGQRKWVRSSLRKLSQRLAQAGHAVSAPTISRLLQKA